MQPGKLDRSFAAVDLSAERLVADVLSSASKPSTVHTTTTFSIRSELPTG